MYQRNSFVKRYLIYFLLISSTFSQSIKNISHHIDNGRVIINYDLTGTKTYDIEVKCKNILSGLNQYVSAYALAGHQYVKAGKKREIWWEPQLEGKSVQGWDISLFVRPAIVRTDISSHPAGASVFVNGKEVGVSPVTLDLPVGRTTIGLKMKDYLPIKKRSLIDISNYNLRFNLKKLPKIWGFSGVFGGDKNGLEMVLPSFNQATTTIGFFSIPEQNDIPNYITTYIHSKSDFATLNTHLGIGSFWYIKKGFWLPITFPAIVNLGVGFGAREEIQLYRANEHEYSDWDTGECQNYGDYCEGDIVREDLYGEEPLHNEVGLILGFSIPLIFDNEGGGIYLTSEYLSLGNNITPRFGIGIIW